MEKKKQAEQQKNVKITRNEVFFLNRMLANIETCEMNNDDILKLHKLKRKLSKVEEEAIEFSKTLSEQLKPANFEEMQKDESESGVDILKQATEEVNAKSKDIVDKYMDETVEIKTEKIDEELFIEVSGKTKGFTYGILEFMIQKFSE